LVGPKQCGQLGRDESPYILLLGVPEGDRRFGRPRRKVKVKFSLEHAIKAQRGSRGIALFFL
jgi:hypothetical protein